MGRAYMELSRFWLKLLIVTGLAVGLVLAYWWPHAPLLAYWLSVAVVLGAALVMSRMFNGIRDRLGWVVWTYAALIGTSLFTTQLAARRAISSTHLVYHGVLAVGLDSLTIGAGPNAPDIRLQTVSSTQQPWLVTIEPAADGWALKVVHGVEQLRVRHNSTRPIDSHYSVARSAVLDVGDAVAVIAPDGTIIDSLRLVPGGIESTSGSTIDFDPAAAALKRRYGSQLASGTALANLDGERSGTSIVYERFVRAQRVSDYDVINGASAPLLAKLTPGSRRYLFSAAPPYSLAGPAVDGQPQVVGDSAFVEVRNADATWRFALLTSWRREPGAQRGVALLFDRNPRKLDTPLPVGMSCPEFTACGAISLRRLPPPVAHISLDHAGFDPDRFGLLGMLRVVDNGYDVVLPRAAHRIERGRDRRPVSVPVTPLVGRGDDQAESRYILLGATGQRDTMVDVLLIGLGIGLLLGAIQSAIRSLTIRGFERPTSTEERAIAGGLAALLALVLTRVTVGARVALFDPFLERGIETAVGLCAAIAVVVMSLLTWKKWLPPFLAGARCVFAGQSSLMSVGRGAAFSIRALISQCAGPQARTALLTVFALALLTYTTRYAVWYGLFTGAIVVLVWVSVAWVAAFTGDHFETYERGAHAVVEQLSPSRTASAAGKRRANAGAPIWQVLYSPDIAMIAAALLLVLAHMLPHFALLAALVTISCALVVVWRRRAGSFGHTQPDHTAAFAGVAVFGAIIAALRLKSDNGPIGAFLLVVFVVLVSVRLGRAVSARIRAPGSETLWGWLGDSLLLAAPLVMLVAFAAIDMGLVLVLVIPLGFSTFLATGHRAGRRLIIPVAVLALAFVVGKKVVHPAMSPIRDASSHAEQAAAFANMSTFFGKRIPIIATPMDRAAARSLATRDPELAERLLVAAGPGPARDLLIPSIEQIWGTRAYARAGWWGEGLGQAVVGGRGVAEAVSYAENTFSVFVLGEHGAVGGTLVLLLYMLLAIAVGVLVIERPGDTQSYRASRALFLVAGLIVVFPASYVALSNVGVVPITGQNMPFLGLNAWSDVAFSAGVIGILITGALRGLKEVRR